MQEESGLPPRHTAHTASAPAPAARSATCSRMLHLKVQFLDDSQKIFVVDVSGYHILISFYCGFVFCFVEVFFWGGWVWC